MQIARYIVIENYSISGYEILGLIVLALILYSAERELMNNVRFRRFIKSLKIRRK